MTTAKKIINVLGAEIQRKGTASMAVSGGTSLLKIFCELKENFDIYIYNCI